MSFDNAYESLAQDHDDGSRWAYGTGFADPLSTVDRAVPAGVSAADLVAYCLMLADDALILSQRLSAWCSRGPELEEDVALANIALDLLGQSRLLLTRAGEVEGRDRDEDAFAFFRDEHEFRNVQLCEPPDGSAGPAGVGDFGFAIARLLVFSTWRLALFEGLESSRDPVLAAIAAKGVKELTYHRDHAALWTVRLGDGTAVSHERMQAGLDAVWPFVDELFEPHEVEQRLAGVAVDPSSLRSPVFEVLDTVLSAATLERPAVRGLARVGGRAGRDGLHTEAMGFLLAELQSVARAHPGASW